MWFEKLTGFKEKSAKQVRENLYIQGDELISKANGKRFFYGTLETPKLSELRQRVEALNLPPGEMTLKEYIGDVQDLHLAVKNQGAFFQVASQFNLLEMVSPEVSPDSGIDNYENDHTQGPACAIAAGAGTLYRNYFANVNEQTGQSRNNQIDTLSDIGSALGNQNESLWKMQNGYALASEEGLKIISMKLKALNKAEIDQIREQLRIGIQWDTEVTLRDTNDDEKQLVTQSYCSALPVAYSEHSDMLWQRFAQLILEASYEATICAAILNYSKTKNPNVYLTMIGGGAFGNNEDWIINAIERALIKYNFIDLNIIIVSYDKPNSKVIELIDRLKQ